MSYKAGITRADVNRIMGICMEGGGYIFNTGETNPNQIPEENMSTYIETIIKLAAY